VQTSRCATQLRGYSTYKKHSEAGVIVVTYKRIYFLRVKNCIQIFINGV